MSFRLALGGQPNWEHNLFRAVLVGHGGADLFRKVYGDRDVNSAKSAKFKETVEVFAKLRGLVDPGSPGRNWNDATSLVITNKAAMHFNGDWAKGEFTAAGQTAGKEYGCTLVGENGGKLVIGGDVFVFPVTKDKPSSRRRTSCSRCSSTPRARSSSTSTRARFRSAWMSTSPPMDTCAQRAHAVLKDPANQVEAMELLSTPNFSGAMQDAVTQYWNNPSMSADAFVEKVTAAMRDAT